MKKIEIYNIIMGITIIEYIIVITISNTLNLVLSIFLLFIIKPPIRKINIKFPFFNYNSIFVPHT